MMSDESNIEGGEYVPDSRLKDALQEAYRQASDLDDAGLEGLCPTYAELKAESARYRDESILGRGGLKQVFRAYDTHAQRWVALARLLDERGPDYYELFVHEARLVASMSHPNIIKVYELGIDAAGRPFFTMDLKGNTSLADVVVESSREELLLVFLKVCDAMAYAHAHGVIHLDLKPENIQCDHFGEVLVCDWGLGVSDDASANAEVGALASTAEGVEIMSERALAKGTPGFMAPEQFRGETRKDARSDVYALGCLLYYLLTGSPPWSGSRDAIEKAMRRVPRVSPRADYPELNISEGLDAIVAKAMALQPQERYENAASLQADLQRYLAGFATRAEGPGLLRRVILFLCRHRLPVAVISLAVCLLSGLTAVYLRDLEQEVLAKQAEAQRAEQLSKQVDALVSEYHLLEQESQQSNVEVAKQIADLAIFLRNMSIFERPIETVNLARLLNATALRMDSTCLEAHTQTFTLDCLQLNYRAALAHPTSSIVPEVYQQRIGLVQAFPDFDFSDERRPSIAKLVEFFEGAATIQPLSRDHLERVLAYDHAVRRNHKDYDQVLQAFLRLMSGESGRLELLYEPEASSLTLNATHWLTLKGQSGYENSLLRFLDFRFLKLSIQGSFTLADLNGLGIESLDLSGCPRVVLTRSLALPHLRKVYVGPGQFEPQKLEEWILTNEPFELIELPE
jgi:serine/threonine-protein kinase